MCKYIHTFLSLFTVGVFFSRGKRVVFRFYFLFFAFCVFSAADVFPYCIVAIS